MNKPIKAVVFDSDGTLIDSFSLVIDAYTHVANQGGLPVPAVADIKAQLAHAYTIPQIMATLFPSGDIQELVRINTEYYSSHALEARGFEGLLELVDSLRARGLKLAIVTGGGHGALRLYERHKLDHHFDSFVHADRVARSKPDPEGFLLAASECGVSPDEMIMVGDSPNDIFAGKNAGAALTIGVTHGHGSLEDLLAADPDYVVDSLADLGKLLERLTPSPAK